MRFSGLNFLISVSLSCALPSLGWSATGGSDSTLSEKRVVQGAPSRSLSNRERFLHDCSSPGASHGRGKRKWSARSLDDMDLPSLTPRRDSAGCARRSLEYNIFSSNPIRLAELREEALKDNSGKIADFFALAAANQYDSGDYSRAAVLYDKLLNLEPQSSAHIYLSAANSHFLEDSYVQAAKYFDGYFELEEPSFSNVYANAAYSHYMIGQYVRAVELYEKALQLDSDSDSRRYNNAAHSHYKSGQYARAAELYEKALQLDSGTNGYLYFCAAMSYYSVDSYASAAKYFDKYLEMEETSDSNRYANAAYSHYKIGQYVRAAELYEKALQLDSDTNADLYFWAAMSYYYLDSYGSAAKYFDKYFGFVSSQEMTGCFIAADCHYKNKNYIRAAELCEKLIQYNSNQGTEVYIYAAFSHYQNGDYRRAAERYNQLLALDPEQDTWTYTFAVASHEKSGHQERAKEIYIEAKRRNPDVPAVSVVSLDSFLKSLGKEKKPKSVAKKQKKEKSSSEEKGKEAMPSAAQISFTRELESARDEATLKGGNYRRAEKGIETLAELMERRLLRKSQRKQVRESWLQACKNICVYYFPMKKYREIVDLFEGRENYLEGDGDLEKYLKRVLSTSKGKLEQSQNQKAKPGKKGKASSAPRSANQKKKSGTLNVPKRSGGNSSSSSEEDEKSPSSAGGARPKLERVPSVKGIKITPETRKLIRRNSMLEVNATLADGGTFDPRTFMKKMVREHGPEVAQTALRAAERAHSLMSGIAKGVQQPTTERTHNNISFTVHLPSGEDISDVTDIQSVATKGLELHNFSKLAEIIKRLRSTAPHSPETWSDGDYHFGSLRRYKNIYYVRITEKHRLFFQVDKKTHKVTVLQVGGHDFR